MRLHHRYNGTVADQQNQQLLLQQPWIHPRLHLHPVYLCFLCRPVQLRNGQYHSDQLHPDRLTLEQSVCLHCQLHLKYLCPGNGFCHHRAVLLLRMHRWKHRMVQQHGRMRRLPDKRLLLQLDCRESLKFLLHIHQ